MNEKKNIFNNKALIYIPLALLLLTAIFFATKSSELFQNKPFESVYKEYDEKLLKDRASSDLVLYFYDKSTLKSKVIDANFEAGKKNRSNLTLMKVDMEKNKGLVEKYKLLYNDEVILINNKGEELTRNSSINNIEEIQKLFDQLKKK
jgi:hypothetical protein